MIQEELMKHFGLSGQVRPVKGGAWIHTDDQSFYLFPVGALYHEDVRELSQLTDALAEWMPEVARVRLTLAGQPSAEIHGHDSVLLAYPNKANFRTDSLTTGGRLGRLHQLSSQFSFNKNNRTSYLQWSYLWTDRIEQLEMNVQPVEETRRVDRRGFEQHLIDMFPYIQGLADNAIQYAFDTQTDQFIKVAPAITHYRFYEGLWDDDEATVLSPTHWLVDHPARDVAEWIRAHAWEYGDTEDIKQFIHDYQKEMPIDETFHEMVFARLLFPLPMIEIAETFFEQDYRDPDDHRIIQQWRRNKDRCRQYEGYLKWYAELYLNGRVPHWLQKVED